MLSRYRVQVYWSPRADTPARMATQIFVFLESLSAVHEAFAGWQFEDKKSGKSVPLDSLARCQEALEQASVEWEVGKEKRKSFTPRIHIGRPASPGVAVKVACGIEPLPLASVFAPNRLELVLSAPPDDGRATRPVLENVLRAAVAMFRPDFGHAGSASVPQPAQAIFSDGTPVVGWMTYLSSAYPPIPASLPSPAAAAPVGAFGTLVVACPELFQEGRREHLAALAAVRRALAEAGVLVPPPSPAR